MTHLRFAGATARALGLVLGLAASAAAGPATDHLKPAVDGVLAALENPALKGQARAEQRRLALRALTDGVFDWTEMARRSLGRHWAARTPAEQQEFVGLFRDLLERAYLSKIERYSGERLVYVGEAADGDQATVRTKLVTKADQEVAMDYRMLRRGGGWRIYDVVIENISLVGNYRTQFDGIIKTSSYEELVKRIRTRAS
jgi:phospholipid transport system substrate-binding protein